MPFQGWWELAHNGFANSTRKMNQVENKHSGELPPWLVPKMLFPPNCPSITAIVCKDQKMRGSALGHNIKSSRTRTLEFLLAEIFFYLGVLDHDRQLLSDGSISLIYNTHRHPNLSTNGNRNVFSSDCIRDFICTPLRNDSVQAGNIYIFITAPARWTVKTFIVPLFGRETLLVTSLSVAPDQTKTLNTL